MVLDQNQRRSILERAQVEIAQDINELQIQQVKMQQIAFKVNEQDMDGIELQEDVEEIMSGKDPSKVRPKAQSTWMMAHLMSSRTQTRDLLDSTSAIPKN